MRPGMRGPHGVAAPHVLVMAKAPAAGRVKTRLCPPCTPAEAAAIAEAALADTLEAVAACGASRLLVALDGEPGPWLPPGFDVFPQCAGPFDRRLAHAWSVAGGPGVQIGMDTPQVTSGALDCALGVLDGDAGAGAAAGAVLGHTADGGWWAIGLRRPDPAVFLGVPMSTEGTGRCQEARLRALGLDVRLLAELVDFDRIEALAEVVRVAPRTRTAHVAHRLGLLDVEPVA
ncbi:MAG: TIGR04282 family arsenosugar biosynthesis glycosyltransferase [Acidimicrobiales bacterium]